MVKANFNPLAPRNRLWPVDPRIAAAGAAALAVGIGAAGNLVSQWVWRRYVQPKRKQRRNVTAQSGDGTYCLFEIKSVEERIVKTRKVRLVLRSKL